MKWYRLMFISCILLFFAINTIGQTEKARSYNHWQSKYIQAAMDGDAEAQYNLSWYLNYPGRRDEALEWCQKSAQNGYASAQFVMGLVYENGYRRAIKIDMEKAVEWFTKAANQGHAIAQFHLAELYSYGDVAISNNQNRLWRDVWNEPCRYGWGKLQSWIYKDKSMAFKWYLALAHKDKELYQKEIPLYRNHRKGIRTVSLLWKRNGDYIQTMNYMHAEAMYQVGVMYYNGWGVEPDDSQAAFWLHKAAEQNYPPAQNDLGEMYENGWGLPQDYFQAMNWYRKAYEYSKKRGEWQTVACYNLGRMYENGTGIKANKKQAIKLYWKAAKNEYHYNGNELLKNICSALHHLGVQFYYDEIVNCYKDIEGEEHYSIDRWYWHEETGSFTRKKH